MPGSCFSSCSKFRDWFQEGFSARLVLGRFRKNRDWFMAKTNFEFVLKFFVGIEKNFAKTVFELVIEFFVRLRWDFSSKIVLRNRREMVVVKIEEFKNEEKLPLSGKKRVLLLSMRK